MTAELAGRPPVADPVPGSRMRREIAEQPARWQDTLSRGDAQLRAVRDRIWSRPPRAVLFVARGTSDHAALYGGYLVQTALQVPAASASPSVVTLYGAAPDLRDVLVVAVSQSGGSPDLVAFVEMARDRGAATLTLTNDTSSALAAISDETIDILAGQETSVAATKSYTAELLTLAALFADVDTAALLPSLPDLGERVLADASGPVPELAARYRYATRVMTAARGYSSASAREAALKLVETSYVSAHGMSSADLLHGPVALLDQSVPLLCFASAGPDAAEIGHLVELAGGRGVDVDVIGDGTVAGRTMPAVLPRDVRPELRPILEILPAQLLAAEVAVARGYDPDAPRGLSKVTRTY
jgi:glucosamine--fructose-6-phosphate aminotransferase (isomerizing)